MDYSSSIHDADNPAGASPWGSSPVASPQHPRISSFPGGGDVPTSPIPYGVQSNAPSYAQEDTIGGGSYARPDSSAGTDSATERPDTAESIRSAGAQQSFPSQQQQPPVQQQRHEPQRYHPVARTAQHPPAQQYKLQAKITGLERTGRKDPILRFDVHVRTHF